MPNFRRLGIMSIQVWRFRETDSTWYVELRAFCTVFWLVERFDLQYIFFFSRESKFNWSTTHFTRTFYQCRQLVPSRNFFLGLNKSHQFLLKKVRITDHFNSIFSVFFSNVKLSKLNHCAEEALLNSDFF